MMQVAIIGSSHLAAFKLGLGMVANDLEKKDIIVHTYGSHVKSLGQLKLKDRRLVASNAGIAEILQWTSGVADYVDLDRYDQIIYVAGDAMFSPTSILSAEGRPLLMSEDLRGHIIQDLIGKNWLGKQLQEVASVVGGDRITYLGQPIESEDAPFAKAIAEICVANPNDQDVFTKTYDAFCRELSTYWASDIKLVRPPREVLNPTTGYTRSEYCRGSVRLDPELANKHWDMDFHHMNGAYGEALLRHIFDLPISPLV